MSAESAPEAVVWSMQMPASVGIAVHIRVPLARWKRTKNMKIGRHPSKNASSMRKRLIGFNEASTYFIMWWPSAHMLGAGPHSFTCAHSSIPLKKILGLLFSLLCHYCASQSRFLFCACRPSVFVAILCGRVGAESV